MLHYWVLIYVLGKASVIANLTIRKSMPNGPYGLSTAHCIAAKTAIAQPPDNVTNRPPENELKQQSCCYLIPKWSLHDWVEVTLTHNFTTTYWTTVYQTATNGSDVYAETPSYDQRLHVRAFPTVSPRSTVYLRSTALWVFQEHM